MPRPTLVRLVDATVDGVSKRFASSLRRGFSSRTEFSQSSNKTGQGYIEPAKTVETPDSTILLRYAFYCASGIGLAYLMYCDYDDEKKWKMGRDQYWERRYQQLVEARQEHERRCKQESEELSRELDILEKKIYGFVPGKEELGASLRGTVQSVSPMIVADKVSKAADGTQGKALNDKP